MPDDQDAPTVDLSTTGYAKIEFPGPSFRPIPEFSFDAPPDWIVSEFADALCFVGTPASLDGPWSNVFLQYERVLPSTALEEVASESWDHTLVDFPDAVIVDERVFEFEQYQYVRECELTLLGERVTRVDAYWFGPDVENVTVDLFHFIGLHPIEAGSDRTVEYLKMLRSFHFPTADDDSNGASSASQPPPRAAKAAPRRRKRALVARPDGKG